MLNLRALTERSTQVKVTKYLLLVLITISTVTCLAIFYQQKDELKAEFAKELEEDHLFSKVVDQITDVMFVATVFTVIAFTLGYFYLIIKQVLVGVIVFATLEVLSMVYWLVEENGSDIGLTPTEIVFSAIEIFFGYFYAFVLWLKMRDDKNRHNEDDKVYFYAA